MVVFRNRSSSQNGRWERQHGVNKHTEKCTSTAFFLPSTKTCLRKRRWDVLWSHVTDFLNYHVAGLAQVVNRLSLWLMFFLIRLVPGVLGTATICLFERKSLLCFSRKLSEMKTWIRHQKSNGWKAFTNAQAVMVPDTATTVLVNAKDYTLPKALETTHSNGSVVKQLFQQAHCQPCS